MPNEPGQTTSVSISPLKRRLRQNEFLVYAKSAVHSPTATCRRGRLREYTGLFPESERQLILQLFR